ncbi:MAG: NAD(P)-dependent alcohol dehydrogenase [Ornithinimicrobium sp.]
MKTVACPRYGGPEVLELRDVPVPVPTDDEILVRVRAAGLNALDWHLMRADPWVVRLGQGMRRPKFASLGADMAGTVEAAGKDVEGFAPGDEVLGEVSAGGFGAFAEYVCVPERFVAHKPSNVTFAEAATLPVSGVTALQALRDQARVRPGETVLVHGASGGVGRYAVQIALDMGADVTAVCSTLNVESIRDLGVSDVVDYRTHDVFADGRQWDVILGVNGFQRLSRYKAALAPGGRYLMIGGTGKQLFQGVAFGRLRSGGGRKLAAVIAKPTAEKLATVAQMAADGKLKPVIDRTYPLEDVVDAMNYLEEGHSRGKTVLAIAGGES